MHPLLLSLSLLVSFGFIASGSYMRYKDRKAAGLIYIIAGMIGIAVIMIYHFFFSTPSV